MKIISYNVNGIRAALKKGFAEWLETENPDIIGLQEVKSMENQIDISIFEDLGYHVYWYPAVKKGYSGVAILSKQKANNITAGIGFPAYDDEGRTIRADYDDFSFLCAYFPSGTTGGIRQDFKYAFLDDIFGYTQDLIKERPKLILSGANKNTSGFLPEERAWMDKFTSSGFDDSFRLLNKEAHQYSWWSYRANARANNKGWRIDYHMTTPSISSQVKNVGILNKVMHSDHCPIVVEF